MRENPCQDKYEWNAEDYAQHSSQQQEWARELIDKLRLEGSEHLLDIGCGDGKVTAEIATYLNKGRVVGIDNSEKMIALATREFPVSQYPNLFFRQMDASELSFYQEFDIVFSNAALHWVIDHRPVLRGIYQALKPSGKVVVQMGGKGNAANILEILDEIMCERQWNKYFKDFSFPYGFYSPKDYEPLLEEVGFKVQCLELKPKTMVHEDIEKFKGWIRTTWLPYLHRVPKDLRNSFINLIAAKYIEKYMSNSDGRVEILMQRLEFIAIK
jgi:trans-aconitate methyltransferase